MALSTQLYNVYSILNRRYYRWRWSILGYGGKQQSAFAGVIERERAFVLVSSLRMGPTVHTCTKKVNSISFHHGRAISTTRTFTVQISCVNLEPRVPGSYEEDSARKNFAFCKLKVLLSHRTYPRIYPRVPRAV